MQQRLTEPESETPLSPKAEQVLNAAQQLFTGSGFEATSMDAVAVVAHVSKATVYAHFENKERLFAAMVQRECRRCMAQMAIPDDMHELELRAALTQIARTFLEIAMSPRIMAVIRVVIAEVPRFPELGEIFYDSGPRVTADGIVRYLNRARSFGLIHVQDTRLAAYQFLGMLRGDLHLRRLLGMTDDADLERIAASAVEAFMRTYAA